MKNIALTILIFTVCCSCSNSINAPVDRKTIEGSYVLQSESEFSKADDTVAITAIKNQRNLYSIERRVEFQRRSANGTSPKETKNENAMAIWNASTGQLREQKYGRVYSLSEDGNQLLIGSASYTRIAGH